MTKNTIEKIITHNRRGFAVHQIWAKFDELERKHAETLRLLEKCADRLFALNEVGSLHAQIRAHLTAHSKPDEMKRNQ